MPHVSVIVPARVRTASPIGECLSALVADTFADKEIIVVDNGCADVALAEVRRLGLRVIPNTRVDAGCAGPRNEGAAAAQGRILMFVDTDVVVMPGTVQRVADVFATEAPAALFGVETEDPGYTNFSSLYRDLWVRFTLLRLPRRAGLLHSSCMAISTEAFQRAGGFDERFRECSLEDAELGRRVVADGGVILRDEAVAFQHRRYFDLARLLDADRSRAAAIVAWQLRVLPEGVSGAAGSYTVPPAHRYGTLVYLAAAASFGLALILRDAFLAAVAGAELVAAIALRGDFLAFLARTRPWHFVARAIGFSVLDYAWVAVGILQGVYDGLTRGR